MSAHVVNADGAAVGLWVPSGPIASQAIKPHLIHETVIAELAWRRAGTHSTLTRGLVRGGGRKPWRQKGTGRARQGSIRSPQWTGGGIVFGPTPRSYGGKVNRKARAQAFRSALRAHVERGTVAIMEPTGWDTPSTKRASAFAKGLPETLQVRPLLFVVSDIHGVDALSFRNLADTYVLAASELETVDVMAARGMVVERSVWERWCGGDIEVEAAEAPKKPRAKAKPEAAATEATVEPVVEEVAPAEAVDDAPVKKPRAKAAKAEEPDIEIVDAAKEETS
jgi:large subunit ribosomal protein L4